MEKSNNSKNNFIADILPRYTILIIGIIFLIFSYCQQRTLHNIEEKLESTASNGGGTAKHITVTLGTGINIQGTGEIQTGDIESGGIGKQPSNEELYISLKDSGNFRSFYPASQGRSNGDYATNSDFMVKYLEKNTFQFNLPKRPSNGYLYIRFKKPTNNTVFAYWYNTKINGYTVSGDLDPKQNLIESNSELLYKLDSIPYIPYKKNLVEKFNWLSHLNKGNQNFIAGFLRVYDGSNQIEEITIAWE